MVIWAIAICLILINAFYVAAEFATIAARTTYIRRLASEGNGLASLLLSILEEPKKLDEYIATCQIGITFSSLILGAYSEINLGPIWSAALIKHTHIEQHMAESAATVAILTVFTLLQILLGELLPKSISLQYSERIALILYWPLRISSTLFRPFIWILNGSGNFLLNFLGIPPSSHRHIHSLDEIELLLAESRDGGQLEPEEQRRLHQALEMSEKTAMQLMTPRTKLVTVSHDTSLTEAYNLALRSPYTRLLAYGESIDDVLGVINVRQIIKASLLNGEKSIRSLIKPVPIVPENLTLGRLITLLKARHSHVAVVMDEHGATRGIVTVGDILAELIEDVEVDEFKQPMTIEALEDGRLRLPGSYKLHRSSRFLGKIPDSDAETINGLIVQVLERIPIQGDLVELDEVILQVDIVEHNAATSVILTPKAGDKQ